MQWVIPVVGHPSAGKSTLIRFLTGVKVPVGKKPGTTRKIRDFFVSEQLIIRDYPGFGRLAHRSRKTSNKIQQLIVDDLENLQNRILVGIVISDLSNVALIAEKLDRKGFIPIDFEMVSFVAEISSLYCPIVLGNKIDKLPKNTSPDYFRKYFPKDIEFFPVALKHKVGLEPFFYHFQKIIDDVLGDDDALYKKWWRV
ncbi:MAG: GTPase [Candidatus Hodarchaeales archaeon]|jgi:GTP-binding protein EngB required for normal cell division